MLLHGKRHICWIAGRRVGETPAEAAGLEPLTGFKWLEVIKAVASAGK